MAVDFDGSKPLLCASQRALDVVVGQEEIIKGLPVDLGAPTFMRIDFAKKIVAGPKQATPIRLIEKSANQLLLHGSELGLGWTFALNQQDGTFTATLVDRFGAIVLFGACTPQFAG
jgi:hypothetical protein